MEFGGKYIIQEINPSDDSIIEKTKELYDAYSDKELFYRYIYENAYDVKSLTDHIRKSERIFVAMDKCSNELLAFVHYSINDSVVALENMLTSFSGLNQSLGKLLLVYSLREMFVDKSLEVCQLNVFEKNRRLLNLFLSIGMKISSYSYWYDITSYCSKDLRNKSFKKYPFDRASFNIMQDHKRYLSLYYKDQSIGTIVNNQYLIIKSDFNYFLFEKINFFFRGSALKSVCLVSKKELELFLIDKSFYLTLQAKEIQSLKVSI